MALRPGEPAAAALKAVCSLLCGDPPSGSGAVAAYDINAKYLRLPDGRVSDGLREVASRGIRVVREPHEEGPTAVALALAVPEAKLAFEQRLSEPLRQALSAACDGRAVTIVKVAAKPHAFRGGGARPLTPPSASLSLPTFFQVSSSVLVLHLFRPSLIAL